MLHQGGGLGEDSIPCQIYRTVGIIKECNMKVLKDKEVPLLLMRAACAAADVAGSASVAT